MFYLACIVLLFLLSPSQGNPLTKCFIMKTYDQNLIIRNISDVMDPLTCQGHCYGDQECQAFTHHNAGAGEKANLCSLFSNTSEEVS